MTMTQKLRDNTWDILKIIGTLVFIGITSWMMVKADERYVQKDEYYRNRNADQQMLQEIRGDIKTLLRQTK